jgi:hypothetical protein
MSRFVYVIEARLGVIKIGIGADPDRRLATVRTHSPSPVRLLAVLPGTHADERELHELFSTYRSHNEWFRVEGPVCKFVEMVRGFGLDGIEPWDAVCSERSERYKAARQSAADKTRRRWADPARRLDQLAGMLAGRLIRQEIGSGRDVRPLHHSKRAEIIRSAHEQIRRSEEGQRLIEEASAAGLRVSPAFRPSSSEGAAA